MKPVPLPLIQRDWSLPLPDELSQVFRGDRYKASDYRDEDQPLGGMQQPGEHCKHDPDNNENNNDLHGREGSLFR
jgi:hypothetical protein